MEPQSPRRTVAFRVSVAIAAVVAVAALAVCCPGIESVPAGDVLDTVLENRPEEELVRVHIAGEPSLVYDKDRGWLSAKCAELFPRAATRVIPADYIESEHGLVPASARPRPPLFR